MKVLEVAVVGSGPAGLYTAEALVKHAAALTDHAGDGLVGPVRVRVDVFDRLPTPYGLVRYGVAPDHKSIKSIAEYLRKVLESPDVRFLGGVHLGEDVTRADLLAAYDAVVYATGAMRDRRLGIPGEDLPGSYAATDFVNWYCGHPDVGPSSFSLDAESVAVIGVGNVAVDVARILARDPVELHGTDVPQPVLDALQASKVREVHMIGRRGPAHAKFTTKELRELGELPGVEVIVPATEADLDAFDGAGQGTATAESDRRVRGNMVVIKKWAAVGCHPRPSRHPQPLRPSDSSRPTAPDTPPSRTPQPSVPEARTRTSRGTRTRGRSPSVSGCGRWRSPGTSGSPGSSSSGPASTRTAPSRARGNSRRSRRRWCCARWGTRAFLSTASRSTSAPPWCRTPLGACSDPMAPRFPASTWQAGSSAVPPG